MNLRSRARFVFLVYFVLVLASAALAILRLSESTEMPGLQAIELVLLALPWSLVLGVEPFSRAGLGGIDIIVFVGVTLNTLVLRSMPVFIMRRCIRPRE